MHDKDVDPELTKTLSMHIADKRLDEWVDVTRLTPHKDQKKAIPTEAGGLTTAGSSATTGSPTSTTDASEAGGRPKRKAIKDEVAALLESMKRPTSRMVTSRLHIHLDLFTGLHAKERA